MAAPRTDLPTDLSVAHALIEELMGKVQKQEHELERLKRYLFGRKSEKVLVDPVLLMYAGLLDPIPAEEEGPTPPEPDPPPKENRGKGRKRRPTRANLRVERTEYPLPEDQCSCRGCGSTLKPFSEEVTRQLDYIPASFLIREHVRFNYACPHCQGSVVTSEMPTPPIAKGMPGAGLLAQILTNKYVDHLPLYRQEKMFAREGIDLSRKTMCDWVGQCATLLSPIVDWMHNDLLRSKIIHTDDTPIWVQAHKRKDVQRHQGRLWVYFGDKKHPYTLFDYTANRCRNGPIKYLKNYHGYLQADAYPGYDPLYESDRVVEVGCMAHARRYFFDAQNSDSIRATQAMAYIRALYEVERQAKKHEKKEKLEGQARAAYRRALRQEKSKPILDAFLRWLQKNELEVLPKSPIREAIGYALKQWDALNRYLDNGDLCIDNHPAEQAIRPIALGRKNWLFLGSDDGGQRAAILYSLFATCKRHEINPFEYLRDTLQRIGDHSICRIHELTPLAWKQAHEQAESNAETTAA